MQNNTLYIVRGLPGAGKSSLANTMCEHMFNSSAKVCEADKYFERDGEYVFNPSELHKAHRWCQQECEAGMNAGVPIIVSNTATTEKELKHYLDLAEKYNYTVVSLIVENRHGNASTHNVPAETIEKMRDRFSIKL